MQNQKLNKPGSLMKIQFVCTLIGIQLLQVTSVLAAEEGGSNSTDWTEGFSSIIGLLNMIGMLLCFGGLLFSAAMFMMGQTERVLYGVVGAAIGGLAWVITKAMFSGGNAGDKTIELDSIQSFITFPIL